MLAVYPLATRPLLGLTGLQAQPRQVVLSAPRRVWPGRVNWVGGVQITYELRTQIGVYRSGREQRIAQRLAPRKSLEYQMLVNADDLRAYKNLMWHWQAYDLVMPEVTRFIELPEAWPAGSQSLSLSAPPYWMQPGGAVVIGEGRQRQALTVLATEGDITHFDAATVQDWPAGTRLYPGLVGHLRSPTESQRHTSDVATPTIRFQVLPLSEVPREPAAPKLMFDGREVFLTRPNWARQVSSALGQEVDQLDYGTGQVSRYVAQMFGTETTSATHTCATHAEADALLDLYLRLRGQQGEAWVPTWEADFLLAESQGAASDRFGVDDPDFAERYAGSPTHRALFVRLADGTLLLRKVVDVIASGGGAEIVVDAPWGVDLEPDQVAMSGWLLLRRLGSDRLVIEWRTNGVAEAQLNWRTLEALDADDLEAP
ncbi:hypothetical protein PRZ61_12230 [Halomonas pacifica]|uniref:hypothetical protein n=1 Tax=Bisbaumannia pacifica TaxID=77098 RepID=UPI002359888B|nr:hypothetical protein [Halomonas pacifica]MDC8804209.1 hypothetical protein [Halomonas pacifica]